MVETINGYPLVLINLTVQLSWFESQTFYDSDLKLKQSKHTRLLLNIYKMLFIISCNHYLLKISELKKIRCWINISNLFNYSAICCRNGKGTTIVKIVRKICLNYLNENQLNWRKPIKCSLLCYLPQMRWGGSVFEFIC